jgi:SAM-dependent methyltransferase
VLTPAQVRALLADQGLLAAADPDDLSTGERLRRERPAELVAAATGQVALRRRAGAKFDRAADMLFTRDGLEQASAEVVARHRARRFASAPDPVLDLCCGIGGDLLALGAGRRVVGVDRDETHAVLARHNASVYGVDAAVAVADVRDVAPRPAGAVFVDPARRAPRGGADRRGGYSPGLDWCTAIDVERVCVKAAPGLDRRLVPPGWEVEFVAVGRELREAVLWSPAWASAAARATVLPGGDTMVASPDTPPAAVRPPGAFLLDPSPAVTRAGAVADLAASIGAWQVDPRIAFLCADVPLRSPFGRSLRVEASLPFGVKPLAAALRRLGIGPVELRRRGLAGDVDDLRRRLRTTGSRRATVLLTRVADRPWTIVCTDLDDA